jgi:hypothetical protein
MDFAHKSTHMTIEKFFGAILILLGVFGLLKYYYIISEELLVSIENLPLVL